jgi:uncharacterized phiE125 gp8 family phage protein
MTFTQPNFWASNWAAATAAHAVSLIVTPVVGLGASSIASPTVLATVTPHGLASGDTVAILGHLGSTPAVDGTRVVTVVDATHVSVPVAVTVVGAGGTITRTIAVQPLTVAQGKLRAGLDWADGDPRDALMTGFIVSARSKVEQDTGLALLTQTRHLFLDSLPRDRRPVELPCRPVQSVIVTSIDAAGAVQTLAATHYVLDPSSAAPIPARLALSDAGAWPTDLRGFQPHVLTIVAGWTSVAALTAAEPPLIDAIGLLVAHAATGGRDRFTEASRRDEYEEKVAPYRLETVA